MPLGICLWCKEEKHLTRHHHPIKKENGGKDIVLICWECHQEYHLKEQKSIPKILRPKTHLKTEKKKKELEKCSDCQKDLTGKITVINQEKFCFKCVIKHRQEQVILKQKELDMRVANLIRQKKFLCSKCQLRKNDLEVTFTIAGNHCLVCGSLVKKIINEI